MSSFGMFKSSTKMIIRLPAGAPKTTTLQVVAGSMISKTQDVNSQLKIDIPSARAFYRWG